MRLRSYLVPGLSLPPHQIMKKAIAKGLNKWKQMDHRKRDERNPTYAKPPSCPVGELHRYFDEIPVSLLIPHSRVIAGLTDQYLSHIFDLLGSGWVQVRHGMSCRGLEGHGYEMGFPIQIDDNGNWLEGRINPANLLEAQRIWRLVDQGYTPIDWHLDFKSGYRWSESSWYLDAPYGHHPGVDIKVPWELARMQHLAQFAFAYGLSRSGHLGFASPKVYIRETRNQILDFVATNPPRFGVNWKCAMDVAIRVANWLVAYDVFRAFGAQFDLDFEAELRRSVYEHALHIFNNLEWTREARGNHYLSDIVGLLFAAAYLPSTKEIGTWLAFAIHELVSEVEYQFTSEGANFEASSSYHRLAAEMVAYATALVLGLPAEKKAALTECSQDLNLFAGRGKVPPLALYPLDGSGDLSPFPPWYINRLEKMGEFTMRLMKPDGSIPQIGDNDSGRFLKLQPVYHPMKVSETKAIYYNLGDYINLRDDSTYWDEDHLDHRHLVGVIHALLERNGVAAYTGEGWFEVHLMRQLKKNGRLMCRDPRDELTAARNRSTTTSHSSPEALNLYAFTEFGLYLYLSDHLYLLIRCGSIGQGGVGGHAHNDNLSFELNVRGCDFLVDGGSYLYTPFPNIRNEFRSTRAHNTLAWGGREQNTWQEGLRGLFWMRNQARARITRLSPEGLTGEHFGFGMKHNRSFELGKHSILVEDTFGTHSFGEINLNFSPKVKILSLAERGAGEFLLEVKNDDTALKVFLKGFQKAVIREGFSSQGYGRRVRNHLVRCDRAAPQTQIKIETGMEMD